MLMGPGKGLSAKASLYANSCRGMNFNNHENTMWNASNDITLSVSANVCYS